MAETEWTEITAIVLDSASCVLVLPSAISKVLKSNTKNLTSIHCMNYKLRFFKSRTWETAKPLKVCDTKKNQDIQGKSRIKQEKNIKH